MADYKKEEKESETTKKILIEKAKAREGRKDREITFNAAILATYGWNISIPVLVGVLVGKFFDKHYPLPKISWTLNFIVIGFLLGIYVANKWINDEGVIKDVKDKYHSKKSDEKGDKK